MGRKSAGQLATVAPARSFGGDQVFDVSIQQDGGIEPTADSQQQAAGSNRGISLAARMPGLTT